jgi:hypothetical protein
VSSPDEWYECEPFKADELYAIDQATAAMETMMLQFAHLMTEQDRITRQRNLDAARKALVRIGYNEGDNNGS